MKKIIYLLTLLSVFLLVIGLGPSIKVKASTVWNNVYLFDPLSTTHEGVSISIEEGTNVFTLHGNITNFSNYSLPSMLSANINGSYLDHTKNYVVYYEYISGTMTGDGYLRVITANNQISNTFTQINVRTAAGDTRQFDYQENVGVLWRFSQSSATHTMTYYNVSFNQLKYKLSFVEVPDVYNDDLYFFTGMSPITVKGVLFTFTNPNTVVLSGTTSNTTNVDLFSKVNSVVSSSGNPMLITYRKVSGTTTDNTWGFSFDTPPVTGPTIIYSDTATFGIVLDSFDKFFISPNLTARVYTDLTLQFYAQEIEIYSEENPGDPEPSNPDPVPGDSTTPPSGFYLSGSYWFGQIYYNAAEDLPQGSYYVATTEGATFDFDILLQEHVVFGMDEGVRFRVYYDQGQSYDDFDGPGDLVISRIENVVNVRLLIDDVIIDEHNYTIGSSVEASAFVVMVPPSEPVTEIDVSFFDEDGMTLLDSGIYEPGDLIVAPSDPSKSGYIFVGWENSDGNMWNFETDTVGEEPLDLYAKYVAEETPQHTVTFVSNGGSAVYPSLVYDGTTLVIPIPTRSGYNFAGWYIDEELTLLFATNTPVTEDMTLYAKWIPSGGGGIVTPPPTGTSSSTTYIIIAVVLIILVLGVLSSKKKG